MYADDHQVYSSGDRIEDVESTLNNQGGCISKWYQENLLKCYQEKFQVMSLGPRHKKKEMNIDIIDNRINSSSVIHLLGVSIDDELNFSNHISVICSKGARKVGVLMRLRNLIPTLAKFYPRSHIAI